MATITKDDIDEARSLVVKLAEEFGLYQEKLIRGVGIILERNPKITPIIDDYNRNVNRRFEEFALSMSNADWDKEA